MSLKLQLTLVISNTRYLEQFIRSHGHLALDQSKKAGISNRNISNFCLCRANFSVPWAVFSRYLKLYSKLPTLFAIFLLKLVFFSTPAGTVVAIVPGRMSKVCQIEFFCFCSSFFLIQYFDSMFWSLGYSIKVLFKDHFTENHGTFETKSYQQKRPRKGNTKKCVAQKYGVHCQHGWKTRKSCLRWRKRGTNSKRQKLRSRGFK